MTKELPATFVKGFHDEDLVRRMEYRWFGHTDMCVSIVSYGCGTLSNLYGELDVKEATKCVHKAVKLGINYIDTAPFYGQGRSEEVLGMALKDIPRESYYMATKVGRYGKDFGNMFDFSAKATRDSVEKSLKLLGLEYVDVIQIHDIEFAKDLDVVVNECLPELEKIVQEGKARYIGVTGYPLSKLQQCLKLAPGRFQVVLSYARNTLLDNSLAAYMNYFQQQKVGIVCASGHALGLLTNAGPQPWHPARDEIKQLCRNAAQICKQAKVELGKLAMYHFMQLSFDNTTFLTGMQTCNLLDINLSAYYNGLNNIEQEVLKKLKDTIFTKPLHWEGYELQEYWAYMEQNTQHIITIEGKTTK